MCIDQGKTGEECKVRSAEEGMSQMCCQRRAEEDKDDREDRRSKSSREDKGDQRRLFIE